MHAEGLSWSICLWTLVLIAQAIFLLEHRQADTQAHVCEVVHVDLTCVKCEK